MKIAVSEIREMLGQPDDGMTDVPLKLRVWMGYIEMAADGIPLDTSDIHPMLARATEQVQTLRIALQVLCDDRGIGIAWAINATRKPQGLQ